MRTIVAIIAIAVGLGSARSSAEAADAKYPLLSKFGVSVGASFPLDGLTDPAGLPHAKDLLKGKPLLINFYTRFCAPCIKEVPKLNLVQERRTDIKVLAITPDSRDEAANYVRQYGLNWPVAADADVLLSKQLKVEAFPAFALLDAKGRLLATVQANQLGGEDGHATVQGIEAWIDAQLGKTVR